MKLRSPSNDIREFAIEPNYGYTYKFDFGKIGNLLKTPETTVSEIGKVIDMNRDACKIYNEYFGFQMVTILVVSSVTILFDCYYLLNEIEFDRFTGSNSDVKCMIFFTLQLFYYVIEILIIARLCTELVEEVSSVPYSN